MSQAKRMLTVAVDLDETLLLVTREPLPKPADALCSHGHIYLRPHAFNLLNSLSATNQIGIWSSATLPYVTEVVAASGLSEIDLAFVWTGRDCTYADYGTGKTFYYKDTDKLRNTFKTDSVLLIDNSPTKIVGHGNDAVAVESFNGVDDDELLDVNHLIQLIQNQPDHITFDKFNWRSLL